MPESRTIVLEVMRYDGERDGEPHFQSFEIRYTDDMSVLQGLQYVKDHVDATLTYRWSCRMAICGSCGMMVNGEPKLACRSFLRDFAPGPLRMEPLAHFPIERDLVVDIGDFVDKLERVQPWIEPRVARALEEGAYRQSPRQLDRYESFSHCINCLLCYAACPQYGHDARFLGPAVTAMLQRYNLDSRDGAASERMKVAHSEEGVWSCTAVGYCSEVCPTAVDPANAVNRTKTESAADWFARLLGRGD